MSHFNRTLVLEPLGTMVFDIVDQWAAKSPSRIAAEFEGETITYAELRAASLHVSRALLSAGVQANDKVPLLTRMSLEMLPSLIGIMRVGACFVPVDVAVWSHSRIEAVLSQVSAPVSLVTCQCPELQLPTNCMHFQRQWLSAPLEDSDDLLAKLGVVRSKLRADCLAWVIFTSGTTGKPKGVMIYHTGIVALLPEFLNFDNLEPDLEARGPRCLLAASVAFDGCQATVWGTLRRGRTLVLASSSSFSDVATTCDVLTLTPSMMAALDPSGPYERAKLIFLGAEAPARDIYRHWMCPGRRIINTYGPSETTCIISMAELDSEGDPSLGELMSGVKVVLVDTNLQEVETGEIMISGPGLAAGYLHNPELTSSKFIQWNGQRFYRTGDLARKRADGQLVFMGRTDSLIKNRGYLVNLETEVEPALLSFEPVRRAIAFKSQRGYLTGCVQPSTVDVHLLRRFLHERYDMFLIPDRLLALESFPLNANNKTDRSALSALVDYNVDQQVVHAEDDVQYQKSYDALRAGFSEVLQVPFKELDRSSSFISLGGHSLAAIRVSNFLNKHGHTLVAVQVLRLDTIEQLETCLNRETMSVETKGGPSIMASGPATATDVQKLFIQRSLRDPELCALISVARYVGDTHAMPTASRLHDAIMIAASAHDIFQTRFDLSDFTLHDLGRLNLDWSEVSVSTTEDLEVACATYEEEFWQGLRDMTTADVEVPYCQVACVSVPDSQGLALVTRMHHVLTDVFSAALFWQDVRRALAGEPVQSGPRIKDFVRFMQEHKRVNQDRARSVFQRMLEELPASAVLQPPLPRSPQPQQAVQLGLVRLDSPVTVTAAALNQAARTHRITVTTLVYAAWSLFLSKITTSDRVGFSVSLSGRTVPWPEAQCVLGSLVNRSIFSTCVSSSATVSDWLTEVHKTALDLVEFDGLTHGLPEELMTDPRVNTTNVLCFLDAPQLPSDWSYHDQQGHNYLIDWYIFPHGNGSVKTVFEVQSQRVELGWAKTVSVLPGQLLDQLTNATPDTLIMDLLK
jgi:amino acid adenylation domain-containing protein